MSNPLIDIIIAHHGERFNGTMPMLDMLMMQSCVNKNDFRVTFITDTCWSDHIMDDALDAYGKHMDLNFLICDGTSLAEHYNCGLVNSTADWVMFCHYDDLLADVCSLRMLLDCLPTDDCDLIWTKVARETRWVTGSLYVNCVKEADFSCTCGKMYRRQFLTEKDITFSLKVDLHTEAIFNTIVIDETEPSRIKHLTTEIYPYFKRFTKNGRKHTPAGSRLYLDSITLRADVTASDLQARGKQYEADRTLTEAICQMYHSVYRPETDSKELLPDMIDFYRNNRDVLNQIAPSDLEVILASTEAEMINYIQNCYNEQRAEYYFVNDNITFEDWLKQMDALAEGKKETEQAPADLSSDPHVVVYCGTRNVYENMVDSLKSLLCNTPVDAVYFLTEDDTFPYDLPDIVRNVNVSNQTWFPPDGPNYDNCWTWMCMVRAAYPELFPQYSKVLSLDIDVVIKDNVSDLWNYDMSDYYIAGVPEPVRQKKSGDPVYINFGICMMNLDKLRADNKQAEIIDMLNRKKLDCPEQTAFNTACAGKILPLPNEYNVTPYSHITGAACTERIVHYAGQKFWRYYSSVKQYADMNWNEIMQRQNELKRTDAYRKA